MSECGRRERSSPRWRFGLVLSFPHRAGQDAEQHGHPSRRARPTVVGRAGSEIPRQQDGRGAADGTSACACYRETVAGGRHIGVCLLQGDSGRRTAQRRVPATGRQWPADGTSACACYREKWPADGTTACACYMATLTGGRHNGVCLLHGDSGSRTARGSVPATIVLRRAFIGRAPA